MSQRLVFPRQSRAEASLRQRIGAGLVLPYQLAGMPGELLLSLSSDGLPAGEEMLMMSDRGPLWLNNVEALIALIADCPSMPWADSSEQGWYWPLFNQSMAYELQTLFGRLLPAEEPQEKKDVFALQITITLGDDRVQSTLCASFSTFAALLNQPGWQSLLAPFDEALPLIFPLTLGGLTLSIEQISQLGKEDVLLTATGDFSPQGHGRIHLPYLRLQGELIHQPGEHAGFYITDLETTNVTFPYDNEEMEPIASQQDQEDEWSEQQAMEPSQEPNGFSPLPLTLTVRCGQLRLTLGELQRLGAGATVLVDNVQPGDALLCHGDYPLAKGELVDVEGRLGFQITHMLPGNVNPLIQSR